MPVKTIARLCSSHAAIESGNVGREPPAPDRHIRHRGLFNGSVANEGGSQHGSHAASPKARSLRYRRTRIGPVAADRRKGTRPEWPTGYHEVERGAPHVPGPVDGSDPAVDLDVDEAGIVWAGGSYVRRPLSVPFRVTS